MFHSSLAFNCHSARITSSCMCSYQVHMWQQSLEWHLLSSVIAQWYSIDSSTSTKSVTLASCSELACPFSSRVACQYCITAMHISCIQHWHICVEGLHFSAFVIILCYLILDFIGIDVLPSCL